MSPNDEILAVAKSLHATADDLANANDPEMLVEALATIESAAAELRALMFGVSVTE